MTNLIFIEGVSGAGKSTAVTAVAEALRAQGHKVCHYIEGDPDCPLDLYWAAYLTIPQYESILQRYPAFADELMRNVIAKEEAYILLRYQVWKTRLYSQDLSDELHRHEFCYNPTNVKPVPKLTEVFVRLWQRFAEGAGQWDYAVFDASWLSHRTNDLLTTNNAVADEIADHLEALLATVRHLNPAVFYLAPDNVRACRLAACQSRKKGPPSEENIQFWKRRYEMDMKVLPKLSIKAEVINITNGWVEVAPAILKKTANSACK